MFAIAFDMDIKELRNTYGDPYNNAYYEIKIIYKIMFVAFLRRVGSFVPAVESGNMSFLLAQMKELKKTSTPTKATSSTTHPPLS